MRRHGYVLVGSGLCTVATIFLALRIDPPKYNESNVRRPIRTVDKSAKPIQEILTT
jgi:hypothetical protein